MDCADRAHAVRSQPRDTPLGQQGQHAAGIPRQHAGHGNIEGRADLGRSVGLVAPGEHERHRAVHGPQNLEQRAGVLHTIDRRPTQHADDPGGGHVTVRSLERRPPSGVEHGGPVERGQRGTEPVGRAGQRRRAGRFTGGRDHGAHARADLDGMVEERFRRDLAPQVRGDRDQTGLAVWSGPTLEVTAGRIGLHQNGRASLSGDGGERDRGGGHSGGAFGGDEGDQHRQPPTTTTETRFSADAADTADASPTGTTSAMRRSPVVVLSLLTSATQPLIVLVAPVWPSGGRTITCTLSPRAMLSGASPAPEQGADDRLAVFDDLLARGQELGVVEQRSGGQFRGRDPSDEMVELARLDRVHVRDLRRPARP